MGHLQQAAAAAPQAPPGAAPQAPPGAAPQAPPGAAPQEGVNPQLAKQMEGAVQGPSGEQVDPNIGLVDVTTPEGQANPNNLAPDNNISSQVQSARDEQSRGEGLAGPEQEATPEEQKAYDEALDALQQILYEDEERSKSIVEMIQPEDKVGTLVKTAVTLIKQLDEAIDLDENVVAEITVDMADRLMEMAETASNIKYSDKEAQAVAGATWEGVMALFGIDSGGVEEMTQGMSDDQLKGYERQYKEFLGD